MYKLRKTSTLRMDKDKIKEEGDQSVESQSEVSDMELKKISGKSAIFEEDILEGMSKMNGMSDLGSMVSGSTIVNKL